MGNMILRRILGTTACLSADTGGGGGATPPAAASPALPAGGDGTPATPAQDATLLTGDKPADAPPQDPAPDAPKDGDAKDGEGKDADKPAGPPEKYDFAKALPEGMELDEGMAAAFEPMAREMGLTQEQAEKLVGLWAKNTQAASDAWASTVTGWQESARADKEFGGAGLEANLGLAKSALKQFGTPELEAYLNEYGAGNHPEVIRLLVRVGKALGEDQAVTANGSPGAPRNIVDTLYG